MLERLNGGDMMCVWCISSNHSYGNHSRDEIRYCPTHGALFKQLTEEYLYDKNETTIFMNVVQAILLVIFPPLSG